MQEMLSRTKSYYVYIMGSPSGTLYVGVTNNLEVRVWQHKNKVIEGFTKKYGCTELLYFEETSDINAAIAREKQIKNWNRNKKELLITNMNPKMKDLAKDWSIEDPSNRRRVDAELPRDDKKI